MHILKHILNTMPNMVVQDNVVTRQYNLSRINADAEYVSFVVVSGNLCYNKCINAYTVEIAIQCE